MLGEIIVIVCLLLAVFFALRSMIRGRRKGASCGCGGCENCSRGCGKSAKNKESR